VRQIDPDMADRDFEIIKKGSYCIRALFFEGNI
jgi:hypothetical protein